MDRGVLPRQQIDLQFEYYKKWTPTHVGIESNSLSDCLGPPCPGRKCSRRGLYFEVEEIKYTVADGNKIKRVEGILQPRAAAGYLSLHRPRPDLLEQFPGMAVREAGRTRRAGDGDKPARSVCRPGDARSYGSVEGCVCSLGAGRADCDGAVMGEGSVACAWVMAFMLAIAGIIIMGKLLFEPSADCPVCAPCVKCMMKPSLSSSDVHTSSEVTRCIPNG